MFAKVYMQAVLFNKKKYNKLTSRNWLASHNYNPIKPAHVTKNYIRYRLREPNALEYRTMTIGNNIKAIVDHTHLPQRKIYTNRGGDIYNLVTQSPKIVNGLVGAVHALTSLGALGGIGYAAYKKLRK